VAFLIMSWRSPGRGAGHSVLTHGERGRPPGRQSQVMIPADAASQGTKEAPFHLSDRACAAWRPAAPAGVPRLSVAVRSAGRLCPGHSADGDTAKELFRLRLDLDELPAQAARAVRTMANCRDPLSTGRAATGLVAVPARSARPVTRDARARHRRLVSLRLPGRARRARQGHRVIRCRIEGLHVCMVPSAARQARYVTGSGNVISLEAMVLAPGLKLEDKSRES
jgi:hypothetical protein